MADEFDENSTTVFVEDWLCCKNTLGEGAYGEVKLLIHKHTNEKIACKIINHDKYKDAFSNINREVTIHKILDHENIIKYYGRRQEPNREYIFLEYAAGGELFQLIEPDVGMPVASAQLFMKQLLCGLGYLHEKGITHRDIKPENILISAEGTLKISDFGMATLFRFKGKERLLDKKCGTKPYLAPEVLKRPYRAQPADIWSCGIVFVAMLTGELPWGDTTDENSDFSKWKTEDYILDTPWSKLSNTALNLARNILNIDSKKRFNLKQINDHLWMKFNFKMESSNWDTCDSGSQHIAKRSNSMINAEINHNRETPIVTLSQPVPAQRHNNILKALDNIKTSRKDKISFSQPTQNDNLVIQFTQTPIEKDDFENLIKRFTRFYVSCSKEKTLEVLCAALESAHLIPNIDVTGTVSVSTWDMMKNQLVFKINLLNMNGKVLLDFRLSKGCGLQFKKLFLKVKEFIIDNCN
ncbi:serine/threonine-protein kinase grp [Diorhabda carinulata]|uniref:serine/threonine-protein kinase grp n=1 Tax=Diorhabda carinulata TaxID=1163345 RepID=UPI0025A2E521|nr:serine/threonine-protein kinase grp [Diorhabda carinulata]